jgi:hypothetical protein
MKMAQSDGVRWNITLIPSTAAAADFFRSGAGVGGTTLPDGAGDTTDAIVHVGRAGFGSLDPTLLHTRLQSADGFAGGTTAVVPGGAAPGPTLPEEFHIAFVAGGHVSLPAAASVEGRMYILSGGGGAPLTTVNAAAGTIVISGTGWPVASSFGVAAFDTWVAVSSLGFWWVGRLSSGGSLNSPTVTTPARLFNTTYTPSATRPVLVLASVEISCTSTLSLLSADDGQVNLVSDLGAPATVRASVRNRNLQTLGLLVGSQQLIRYEMSFLLPAGWSYRLNTVSNVAAPTFSLINVVEEVL